MDEKKLEESEKILRELKKNLPPVELEEFSIELGLALDIFFEGKVERNGQKITLTTPTKQKFRVTAELIS